MLKFDIAIFLFFVNLIIPNNFIAVLINFLIYSFVFLVFPVDFIAKDLFFNFLSAFLIYKIFLNEIHIKKCIKVLLCIISILYFTSSENIFHLYILFIFFSLIQNRDNYKSIEFNTSNLFFILILILNLLLAGSFKISNQVMQNEILCNLILLISFVFTCYNTGAFGISFNIKTIFYIIPKYISLIIYYYIIKNYAVDANFNLYISLQVLSIAAFVFDITGYIFVKINDALILKRHTIQYLLILIFVSTTFQVQNSMYSICGVIVIDHILDVLLKSKSQIKNVILIVCSLAIIGYIKYTIFIDLNGKMNFTLWIIIFSISSLYFYKLLLNFIKLNEKRVFNKIQESRNIIHT